MTAQIIDGKAFSATVQEQVRIHTAALLAQTGVQPGLAVILVGEDPASEVYVKNKGKMAQEVGFYSETWRLPDTISQEELLAKIAELNANPAIHGILVQLPLPEPLDKDAVLEAIDPAKDVDGFHPVNVGRLWNREECSVPCTPLGCSLILREWVGEDLSGKNALMIGSSNIVGRPMAALLLKMNATVTVAHRMTRNVAELARQADILIVATGQPHLVKGDWIKPGAIVLDVGITRVIEDGKTRLVGDVDFEAAREVASAITPVPGGIGPMTIACLLQNTLNLAIAQIRDRQH